MRIVRVPGVFRPRSDTWLLASVLRGRPELAGGAVLDVCTGSGALAITAALAGARSVTAVDVSAARCCPPASTRGSTACAWRRSAAACSTPCPAAGSTSSSPTRPTCRPTHDGVPARGRARHTEAGVDGPRPARPPDRRRARPPRAGRRAARHPLVASTGRRRRWSGCAPRASSRRSRSAAAARSARFALRGSARLRRLEQRGPARARRSATEATSSSWPRIRRLAAITIGIIALVVICIVLASSGRGGRRRRGTGDASGFMWFGGDSGPARTAGAAGSTAAAEEATAAAAAE